MGFDAGERFCGWQRVNMGHSTQDGNAASWIPSEAEQQIYKTVYEISAESGQLSSEIPAAIPGVTRNDE
jgi:hypothetical protein